MGNSNNFVKKQYEDSPWVVTRRTGNLLRVWAEVFRVSPSGSCRMFWQQVSEDLVLVSITCVQDSPNFCFRITAYNSKVNKIMDENIIQPGTRLGQASACFIYWKNSSSGVTWGLNFTSSVDARQFREVVCGNGQEGLFNQQEVPSQSVAQKEDDCRSTLRANVEHVAFGPTNSSTIPAAPMKCTCATKKPPLTNREPDISMCGTSVCDAGLQPKSKLDSAVGQRYIQCCDTIKQATLVAPRRDRLGKYPLPEAAKPDINHFNKQIPPQCDYVNKSTRIPPPNVNYLQRPDIIQAASQNMVLTNERKPSAVYGSCKKGKLVNPANISNRQHKNMPTTAGVTPESNVALHSHHTPFDTSYTQRRADGSAVGKGIDISIAVNRPSETVLSGSCTYNKRGRKDRDRATATVCEGRAHHKHPRSQSLPRDHCRPEQHLQFDQKRAPSRCSVGESFISPIESPEVGRRHGPQSTSMAINSKTEGSSMDRRQSPDLSRCHDLKTAISRDDYEEEMDIDADDGIPTMSEEVLFEYEQHLRSTLARGDNSKSCSLRAFQTLMSEQKQNSDRNSATSPNIKGNLSKSLPRTMKPHWTEARTTEGLHYSSNMITSPQQRQIITPLPECHRNSPTVFDVFSSRSNSLGRREVLRRCSPNPTSTEINLQDSFEHCLFTSSEVSDDEKMSLTAAVSDEDEFACSKPLYQHASQGNIAFNCTGAVRKAGYLHVKKWILRKKHRIELARKRGWKGYWVCLKGTTLLFYPCESNEGRSIEQSPKHLIIVDGAIMQAIPEHPKRQHIFCLSTAFGDAYLFQAGCDSELNSWINNIHTACAAAFARHRGKAGTLHLLQEDTLRVERSIESESNLRCMADMQANTARSEQPNENVNAEISNLEENLERLHCERFRLKCYMASLQNSELPNPKMLLTRVSRATKLRLSRLGVFAVSSLHAHVCAHSPSLLQNLLTGRGATKRRAPVLGTADEDAESPAYLANSHRSGTGPRRSYRVKLPAQTTISVPLGDNMTVEEFLSSACLRRSLQPSEHFLIMRKSNDTSDQSRIVPLRSDAIQPHLQTHDTCEVVMKQMFQTELTRPHLHQLWGFSVEAELVENENRQDELCCYISRVEEASTACSYGLISGDEILVINGAIVADLDMMYIESLLQEQLTLCIMARTSRVQAPDQSCLTQTTDELIQKLVCPPPPQHSDSPSRQTVEQLVVPPINSWEKNTESPSPDLRYTCTTIGRTKVIHIAESHPKDTSIESHKTTGAVTIKKPESPERSTSETSVNPPMVDKNDTEVVINRSEVPSSEDPNRDTKFNEFLLINLADSEQDHTLGTEERNSVEQVKHERSQSEENQSLSLTDKQNHLTFISEKLSHKGDASDTEIRNSETNTTTKSIVQDNIDLSQQHPKNSTTDPLIAREYVTTKADDSPQAQDAVGKKKTVVSESRKPASSSSNNPPPHSQDNGTDAIFSDAPAMASDEQSDRKSSLTDVDKLKLQLSELITTERTYAQNLNLLIECYLTPLRSENIMSEQEVDALFGNIPHIVSFQKEFLQCLEQAIGPEESTMQFNSISQFKNILTSVANTFVKHSLSFKLYSVFCTSHSRAQKVLHHNGGNTPLQRFLQRQNPGQQHSSTLESYLIMPIQRLLRYPLLLQQLKSLVEKQSDELYNLEEALDAMEKIAEYINEVQRIHEEYGAIFDHLSRQYEKTCSSIVSMNTMVDLSPGELLHYGGVEWLNITDVLGKIKKGLDLHTMCFVFRTAVVIMCKERLKQKRRLMLSVSKQNASEMEIVRYQALLPVTEVQVRTNQEKDTKPRYTWHLIHLKSQIHRRNERIYHFSNSDTEYRNSFMRSIRLIIRDSVRTMSVPVTKVQSGGCRVKTSNMSRTLSVRRTSSSRVDELRQHGSS